MGNKTLTEFYIVHSCLAGSNLIHFLFVTNCLHQCSRAIFCYSNDFFVIQQCGLKLSVPGVITDSFLLFSMMDKAKLCYIYFSKKANLDFKKLEKMSALEPKVLWAVIIFCDSTQCHSFMLC